MGRDLFRFFNTFICGVIVAGISAKAMTEDGAVDPEESKKPSIAIVKPSCDPLPSNNQVVCSVLKTPVASLMNLEPLYKMGISGRGQMGAIIESAPIHTAPGMSGVIMNSIESYDKDDHASMVAQVVGSQIPGIGLAPRARVFLGSSQAKINDEISVSCTDAVKLAIRAGAKAINLSFMKFETDSFSEKEQTEDKEKGVHYDFTSAIKYALRRGIPVFTSGGNDAEDMEATRCLKEIIERANIYHDELLVIAGGFEYPNQVFDRKDIVFSEDSARVTSKDFHLRRLMLTAPYKVEAYEHESKGAREKKRSEFRKRLYAEELRNMWLEDFSKFLKGINPEHINPDTLEKIKINLKKFDQLYKDIDNIGFTNDDCAFFTKLANRSDLPYELRQELLNFGKNFLALYIDLLATDNTQKSLAQKKEHKRVKDRIEARRKKLVPDYIPTSSIRKYYKSETTEGPFEEVIMLMGKDQKLEEHEFSLQTVHGTSFSSPALMAVFLLLTEYAEREGNLLKAEDIIRCMRASAWKKPYPEEGEDLAWYGSGVADGGKALEYCQLLIRARTLSLQQHYEESLKAWKTFLALLKGHAKGKYILELIKAYKSSSAYHTVPHTESEKVLEEFYKDILSLWPEVYKTHWQERFKAFMLFEKEEYKEARDLLRQMCAKTKHILQRKSLAEAALFSLLNKKDRPFYCSFTLAKKKFDAWIGSLIESELKKFIPYQMSGGVLFFEDKPSKESAPILLDIRGGNKVVSNFLNDIEKLWGEFETLNLKDPSQNFDGDIFLSMILNLPEKLKAFALPEELYRTLEGHVEKAKKEKERLDSLKNMKTSKRSTS